MTADLVPARGPSSFRRIVDVPFETFMAALDSWQRTGPGGGLRIGRSQVRGPAVHDRDTGTRRIQVGLARGPLRPLQRMRLEIDCWSCSATAIELIPCGRVRPTAAYFRAGHLMLDSLIGALPQYLPPARTAGTIGQMPAPPGPRLTWARTTDLFLISQLRPGQRPTPNRPAPPPARPPATQPAGTGTKNPDTGT
jgi:hypothetical protein